jgi:hypothetical protein
MKTKVIALIFILIAILGLVVIFRHKLFPVKAVHFHAGFQVYKDDKLQNFSDPKYMHQKPCTTTNTAEEPEDEQIEKAHLHDLIGDVVHIHRENVTWQALFNNLKYPIDTTHTIAYRNNKKIDNFLLTPIHPYDSLVLFIGKNTQIDKKLSNAVKKAHIQQIEKQSENCGGKSE